MVVRDSNSVLPESPPLSLVIANALSPLGFTGPAISEDPQVPLTYYSLGGGRFLGPRIDVSLDVKSQTVYLFDFNSSSQTDITRKIQDAIKRQVNSDYRATIEFRPPQHRVADCFGP